MTANITRTAPARRARVFRISKRSKAIALVFVIFGLLSMPWTLFGLFISAASVWTAIGEVRPAAALFGLLILAMILPGLALWDGYMRYLSDRLKLKNVPHLWMMSFAFNASLAIGLAVGSDFDNLLPVAYAVPMGLSLIAFARDVRLAG